MYIRSRRRGSDVARAVPPRPTTDAPSAHRVHRYVPSALLASFRPSVFVRTLAFESLASRIASPCCTVPT
ncbi:hypothetical protein EXIGLDRAFT_718350 [Exidia glandulosa HHB12029]|uniref:Uncharacterized protein n=1 Tax=Exidia glandulosa HHB12029 TaxID=1314781 RepID=A0A165YZG7_EXIGL|nr:hypothetical protein EXIGLDRAFT_718350 [Exidia glandulosa HHB12029]